MKCHLFSNVRRPAVGFDSACRGYAEGCVSPGDVVCCLNRCVPLPALLASGLPGALVVAVFRVDNGSVTEPVFADSGARVGFGELELLGSPLSPRVEKHRADDTGLVRSVPEGRPEGVVAVPGYPGGKCPTTGCLAAHYLQRRFPAAELVLVNFFGPGDDSTDKWCGHAWEWEWEWARQFRHVSLDSATGASPPAPD